MIQKDVQISGHTTAYLEAGEGNPEAIVFIHDGAFGTTAELCWAPVMEGLSEEFHVLAPELYGWGGSDKHYPFGQSPYPYRIEQVSKWLEYVGVDNAVGASFGGSITLRATMEDSDPWNVRAANGGLFQEGVDIQ